MHCPAHCPSSPQLPSLLPSLLNKVYKTDEIRKYLNEKCLDRVLIEVDGGIKLHNAEEVINAGADVLVAGSAIFGADDPVQTMKDFYLLGTH